MDDTMKIGVSHQTRGTIWDERGNSDIVRILISYDTSSIKSVQFVYAEKGGVVRHSKVYGVPDTAFNFRAVAFDYPSEFLTSVSGKYIRDSYTYYKLCSITFGTNKGKYGPFGTAIGNTTTYDFNYDFGDLGATAFGGFHGCVYDQGIVSIGIYIKPVHTLNAKCSMIKESQAK